MSLSPPRPAHDPPPHPTITTEYGINGDMQDFPLGSWVLGSWQLASRREEQQTFSFFLYLLELQDIVVANGLWLPEFEAHFPCLTLGASYFGLSRPRKMAVIAERVSLGSDLIGT